MSKVNQTQAILTEQQFNSSPLKSVMSYKDYMDSALKLGSAFTFARAMTMQKAEQTSDGIKDSVKGFYLEREAKKNNSEQEYYAALEQYDAMKSGQYNATQKLNYATNIYGEGTSQFNDAYKKYNMSDKSLFSANLNLSIARDHFNSDNSNAFKAYLTSRLV